MQIKLTSIMVNDQEKALAFYTGVLDFRKKQEFPVGAYKWITVVSPEGPEDVEGKVGGAIGLHRHGHRPARAWHCRRV